MAPDCVRVAREQIPPTSHVILPNAQIELLAVDVAEVDDQPPKPPKCLAFRGLRYGCVESSRQKRTVRS